MKKFILVLSILVIANASFAKSTTVVSEESPLVAEMALVNQVQTLPANTVENRFVKLISYSLDTAMNGNFVILAVYNDQESSFNVYKLANIADYKLLPSKRNGFLKLAIWTDKINEDGEIVPYKSTLFVNLSGSEKSNGTIEIEEIR